MSIQELPCISCRPSAMADNASEMMALSLSGYKSLSRWATQLLSHPSANALDIVASSALLVHAVRLTAPKKWFDQWWQTTGDPEETDGFD